MKQVFTIRRVTLYGNCRIRSPAPRRLSPEFGGTTFFEDMVYWL